jgi:hypothetical protein
MQDNAIPNGHRFDRRGIGLSLCNAAKRKQGRKREGSETWNVARKLSLHGLLVGG